MLVQGELSCIVREELRRALKMVVEPHKVNLGCEGQERVEESERQFNSRRICQRCQKRRER